MISESIAKLRARLKLRILSRTFSKREYLEAYAAKTDLTVSIDPEAAIGGLWNEMGKWQLAFLKKHGLQTRHSMLDIGCGTLRAGLHFIEYLEAGNYYGMDISRKAIEHGWKLVERNDLAAKVPRLSVSEERNLKFAEYKELKFDFILAQSVFSHLRPEDISECFEHIANIMTDDSLFFFTFHPANFIGQRDKINFEYPRSFFLDLAKKYSFELEDVSEEYKHPREQGMYICRQLR